MIKYLTTYGSKIAKVEVDRETDSSVWIRGRRFAKRTTYENYFDTWEEAFFWLLDKYTQKLEFAQNQVNYAQHELQKIKELKP